MASNFPPLFDPDNLPPRVPIDQQPKINHLEVVRSSFPRIASAIELMWGTPELQQYLSKLIVDDRHYDTGVTRQRFPKEIMASLLVIYNRHTAGAPLSDVWHNAQ